ncbi:MAG: hypothetical protein WCW33_03850 [Candidatus Babeliales bacterium]
MRKCLVALLLLCTLAMREQLCAALTEEDKAKLQALVDAYQITTKKLPLIKRINNLRTKYQQDKAALTAIENAYIPKLTGLPADYEKDQKSREQQERQKLLSQWEQAQDKKAIEQEIKRAIKNLRVANRYLAALELEEGLQTHKKQPQRQIPFKPKSIFRDRTLPDIMQNLDADLYEEGKQETAQKIFWHIQRLVQLANTYLLLNVIPQSRDLYAGVRTSIENLIVALAQGKESDVTTAFEELNRTTERVTSVINLAIANCNKIKAEDIVCIQPAVFEKISKILTEASTINFGQLVQSIQSAWNACPRYEKTETGNIAIDDTDKFKIKTKPSNSELIFTAYAASKQYYNRIQSPEMAKHAVLFGIARPDNFDGLLWRQIAPITQLSTDLLGYDRLRCKYEQNQEKSRPVHQMMYEVQTLVAAATTLKQQLESTVAERGNINRVLYPLRKEINQQLTTLQSVILELHHDLESKTKVFSDELLVLDILADVSIFSSAKETKSISISQDITSEIVQKTQLLAQTTACSKILYDELQGIRKSIFTAAGVSDINDKLIGQKELTKNEQDNVIKQTDLHFQGFKNIPSLHSCITDLHKQSQSTYKDKLEKFIKNIPANVKEQVSIFIQEAGRFPSTIKQLFTKTSMPSQSKINWEKVKEYVIIALVIIVIIVVIAGLTYLSCGVIAPWLGYPWWYGLFFSPAQMCWFKALGLKKTSYPELPQEDAVQLSPRIVQKALSANLFEDTPEFIVEWELTSILFDLMVTEKVISDEATIAANDKSTILTIIQNSTWQHLTMARKAIEKIKGDKLNLATRIDKIRNELRIYFATRRGTTQTA